MKRQSTDHIFMIEPSEFYSNPQTAGSNHYQKSDNQRDKVKILEEAIEEFRAFRDKLVEAEINITTFKGDKGCPDHIFPNWFTTFEDGSMQIFPMKAENRRLEKNPSMIDTLSRSYKITNDLSHLEENGIFLESTSSMVFDRVNSIAYVTLSPRADKSLAEKWCSENGYFPMIFETESHTGQSIYHTDVLMYVGTEMIGVCLDVIKEPFRNDVKKLVERTHDLMEIESSQLLSFCGNCLEVINKNKEPLLVMSSRSESALTKVQRDKINRFYKQIIHSDLTTIEKYGGGSARCMLSELF